MEKMRMSAKKETGKETERKKEKKMVSLAKSVGPFPIFRQWDLARSQIDSGVLLTSRKMMITNRM